MIVVAGPPGGGKSSAFPLANLGTRYFNADDRAAELNGGSYLGISKHIRETVSHEFEAFVSDCISQRESFAIETTLRSSVTFDQAQSAKTAGFQIEMRYVALETFAMHLERIKQRADAGGHSASETTLRRIYDASLANLLRAFSEMYNAFPNQCPANLAQCCIDLNVACAPKPERDADQDYRQSDKWGA
jgi:predicted ABC-type ATPase